MRSGTTSLHTVLDSHSEIYMDKPANDPEVNSIIKHSSYNKINYQNQISAVSNIKYWGEKSGVYFLMPETITTLKENFLCSKKIIILRDPVERAISHYFFSFENGVEQRTIEEVFIHKKNVLESNIRTKINPFKYLEYSNYRKYVNLWRENFNENELYVCRLEDFIKAPKVFLKKLFDFLELDYEKQKFDKFPVMHRNINSVVSVSYKVRNQIEKDLHEEIINYENVTVIPHF